jgi:NhaP-type Na+/H+ or K+/H+ antiporter
VTSTGGASSNVPTGYDGSPVKWSASPQQAPTAGLKFVLGAAGGVAIGIAVGWIVAEIRKRTTDAQVSITISLLTG